MRPRPSTHDYAKENKTMNFLKQVSGHIFWVEAISYENTDTCILNTWTSSILKVIWFHCQWMYWQHSMLMHWSKFTYINRRIQGTWRTMNKNKRLTKIKSWNNQNLPHQHKGVKVLLQALEHLLSKTSNLSPEKSGKVDNHRLLTQSGGKQKQLSNKQRTN